MKKLLDAYKYFYYWHYKYQRFVLSDYQWFKGTEHYKVEKVMILLAAMVPMSCTFYIGYFAGSKSNIYLQRCMPISIVIFILLVFLNHLLFSRKDRWKAIVKRYDAMPAERHKGRGWLVFAIEVFIILNFFFSGYLVNKVEKHDYKPRPGSSEARSIAKENDRIADTTICDTLRLRDTGSFVNYFGKGKEHVLLDRTIRNKVVSVFRNRAKTEYLLANFYEGDYRNCYSAFEIGQWDSLEVVPDSVITETGFHRFRPESGIVLGMSLKTVKIIKGWDGIESKRGNDLVLTYHIDVEESELVKRYSEAGYFMEITFDTEEKVKKIYYGFDYP